MGMRTVLDKDAERQDPDRKLPEGYVVQDVDRCKNCRFSSHVDDFNFGYNGLVCCQSTGFIDANKHNTVNKFGICSKYERKEQDG